MFFGLFFIVFLKMFSFCWVKCVFLKVEVVKNFLSISVIVVVFVYIVGGWDFVVCIANEKY